jgi:Zn-finger nucleic acid-binding protein
LAEPGVQVMFQQVRQMWLSRGACVKMMNRQKAVNVAVRMYKQSDSEFRKAMLAYQAQGKEVGVTAGFDYISGFLSIQTVCYMEVHLS